MKLLFFMPVGPRSCLDFVLDTLRSCCYHYPECDLLILDDTGGSQLSEAIFDNFTNASIYRAKSLPNDNKTYNSKGLLWAKTGKCWLWAIDNLVFDFLVRIDDDSLVIQAGLEKDLQATDPLNSKIGALGQFRLMPDGRAVNNIWPAHRFKLEMSWAWAFRSRPHRQLIKRLSWVATLRSLVSSARHNGWVIGEHMTGGAIVMPRYTLNLLSQRGYLSLGPEILKTSELGDDHLISMLVYAAGLECRCLGGKDGSIGYRLDRLPVMLTQVASSTFKIIHSLRSDGMNDERSIRDYLAKATRGGA